MIITDPKRVRRLRAARRSPYLPMRTFDIQTLCKKIAKAHFPDLRLPVFVSFVEDETLACVVNETDRADIFIHVLMNDPSTPRQVFHHVLTHELIHLIVPYETINGKEVSHTPTFWLHETRLVPERSVSWTWIWRSFGRCLRRDHKNERMCVTKNWKSYANSSRPSWGTCKRVQPSDTGGACTL
jgi:hypothetical protein